jgi:5-methylcytosine-specific restriction endonuclease McrA
VFDVDHKLPLSLGGLDSIDNLQLLNLRVHRIKTTMEAVARNKGKTELHCDDCDISFSRHFIQNHLHLS